MTTHASAAAPSAAGQDVEDQTRASPMVNSVLFLDPIGNLWGSERTLCDFAESLSRAGCQVAVYCPPGPLADALCGSAIQVYPRFKRGLHEKTRFHRIAAAARLLLVALRFKPDVIHVNQAGGLLYAAAVARWLRVPVTTHVRFHEDVGYVAKVGADLPALHRIICISNYIRAKFAAIGWTEADRLQTVYNPYRPRTVWKSSPLPESSSEPRMTFTCVARIEPNKRQDILLQAVAILRRNGRDVRAVFVGEARANDPIATRLQDIARELQIAHAITWAGFQQDVIPWITGAAAQVCPFQEEALGRVIFEAWDAGVVPIAWAGSGGPAEIIRQSGGGILYADQQPESLAEAMRRALALTPEQRRALVTNGRAWLDANCNPDQYVQAMQSVWQEALA